MHAMLILIGTTFGTIDKIVVGPISSPLSFSVATVVEVVGLSCGASVNVSGNLTGGCDARQMAIGFS